MSEKCFHGDRKMNRNVLNYWELLRLMGIYVWHIKILSHQAFYEAIIEIYSVSFFQLPLIWIDRYLNSSLKIIFESFMDKLSIVTKTKITWSLFSVIILHTQTFLSLSSTIFVLRLLRKGLNMHISNTPQMKKGKIIIHIKLSHIMLNIFLRFLLTYESLYSW